MRREPIVFGVAGLIIGFMLGYMAASWGSAPSGAPVASSSGGGEAGLNAPPLDPNELRALESLAGRNKADVQVRLELGNLLMDHARYEDAARWYREALDLDPRSPDAIVDLGSCLVNAGKAAEGLVEFERAIALQPDHKKAHFNKGIALMELGRSAEAVAVWEGLLKRFPDDSHLQELRAQIERVRAAGRVTR